MLTVTILNALFADVVRERVLCNMVLLTNWFRWNLCAEMMYMCSVPFNQYGYGKRCHGV